MTGAALRLLHIELVALMEFWGYDACGPADYTWVQARPVHPGVSPGVRPREVSSASSRRRTSAST